MIRRERVLSDEFIPREVVHRDSEIQTLARTLEPLLDGDDASYSFLHGPPGTGKTCIGQHTLQQLEERDPELQHAYINCWEYYTRFKILYRALKGVGRTLDIHRQSTPTDELYSRLKDAVDRPYIIILDEVDQIQDETVLYDLYTIPEITLIMIATDETALHNLDERIRSRLMSAQRIPFDPYTTGQLTDIVSDRAEWGLEPGSITDDLLHKIALAADGDARIAIATLRTAAQRAMAAGEGNITRDIVNDVIPDAKQETRQRNRDNLNKHQKVLLSIIEDEGTIKPGNLYDRYRETVDDPKTNRALRKYLNKMAQYNLINAEGEGRWRTYSAVDQ